MRGTVAVPVWRDPWIVVGARTFAVDLLGRLGLRTAFADGPDRYPHVALERLDADGIDLVLLPDSPGQPVRPGSMGRPLPGVPVVLVDVVSGRRLQGQRLPGQPVRARERPDRAPRRGGGRRRPGPRSAAPGRPQGLHRAGPGHEPTRETALSILGYAREHLAPYLRVRRIEFAELSS